MEKKDVNITNSTTIYSVESRKGGVGKTTIALNLAKALVDKGYDVLLIDCDITGTPITKAACNSPYWKKIVKPIQLCKDGDNLIQYFENIYLKGENISKEIIDGMKFNRGRVHLIGSEIYDENGVLIIDPRLLMDDLHSHWFVELLKDIRDLFFEKTLSKNKAIILDNSPGYVGIGKSIRNWLTSLGANNSHFILVSSLDEQDVESTISSALDIEKTMKDKWYIAFLNERLLNGEGDYDYLNKFLNSNQDYREFFYSLEEEESIRSINSKYSPEINKYISVVLNKVPNIYHDVNIGYKIKDGGIPKRKEIIDKLFPLDDNGMPQNIIEYDASVSGQFIESSITGPAVDAGKAVSLKRAANSFNQKIERYRETEDKVGQSFVLFNALDSFKEELIKLGYKPLVNSMSDNIIAPNYVQDILDFVSSLGNVALSDRMMPPFSHEETLKGDLELLVTFINEESLLDYSAVLISLFRTLYKKAGFYRKTGNRYLLIVVSLLFRAFLGFQRQRIEKDLPYRRLLLEGYSGATFNDDSTTYYNWYELIKMNESDEMMGRWIYAFMDNNFKNFYKKMCYTLLRLFDCADDFQLVLRTCMETINRGGRTINSNLRAYCRSVISKKSEDYDDSKYLVMLDKPFEMNIVKEALKRIVLK